MADIRVKIYQPSDRQVWNDFVRRSKNGTFLFEREFMDYHADRFKDHSIMIFEGEALRCVLPANEHENSVVSHAGLSYGGLVLQTDVAIADVLAFFHYLLKYLSDRGIKTMLYKCAPPYQARVPSFEDQYGLFLANATLLRRDMSAVCVQKQLSFRNSRKQAARKAADRGYRIVSTKDVSVFWEVLEKNLMDRHGVRPVHSIEEIRLLMTRFPEQIHCFEVGNGDVLGGTIIFETATTAHTQYISATPEGRASGALDLLFHVLINETFSHKTFFSFGTSNKNEGRVLDLGLNSWKEGFGARTFPLDLYRVETANFVLLDSYA